MQTVKISRLSIFVQVCATIVATVGSGSVWSSTLTNNVALSSLGATALDNGNWVEQASPNAGFEYDAMLAIDDVVSGASIWYGIGSLAQQQMWVIFDKEYLINSIFVDEQSDAYMTSGNLEYLQKGVWTSLQSVNKSSADLLLNFSAVRADGVRLNIDSVVAPSGWTNKVAGVYSLEVQAVPVPAAVWLFGSGLVGLIGVACRKSK